VVGASVSDNREDVESLVFESIIPAIDDSHKRHEERNSYGPSMCHHTLSKEGVEMKSERVGLTGVKGRLGMWVMVIVSSMLQSG
jgi:hypothetical protein